jgi:hypothetical protein
MVSTRYARTRGRRAAIAAVVIMLAVLCLSGTASARTSAKIQFPGFVLSKGRYTTIVAPGAATQTLAFGINNRREIVGAFDDADGRGHGCLRDRRESHLRRNTCRSLGSALTTT